MSQNAGEPEKENPFSKALKHVGHGIKVGGYGIGHGAKYVGTGIGHGAKYVGTGIGHGARGAYRNVRHHPRGWGIAATGAVGIAALALTLTRPGPVGPEGPQGPQGEPGQAGIEYRLNEKDKAVIVDAVVLKLTPAPYTLPDKTYQVTYAAVKSLVGRDGANFSAASRIQQETLNILTDGDAATNSELIRLIINPALVNSPAGRVLVEFRNAGETYVADRSDRFSDLSDYLARNTNPAERLGIEVILVQ